MIQKLENKASPYSTLFTCNSFLCSQVPESSCGKTVVFMYRVGQDFLQLAKLKDYGSVSTASQ